MLVKTASLAALLKINDRVTTDFVNSFSGLSPEQLNWKPRSEAWSIAQCAEHLIKTDGLYLPVLESVLNNSYQRKFLELVPGLTNLSKAMFFWGLTTPRKMKAPAMFVPASSGVAPTIINDFIAQLGKMKLLMERVQQDKAEQKTCTAPSSQMIVFRLLDVFKVSTLHAQRHFQQALNVKNNPNFPS